MCKHISVISMGTLHNLCHIPFKVNTLFGASIAPLCASFTGKSLATPHMSVRGRKGGAGILRGGVVEISKLTKKLARFENRSFRAKVSILQTGFIYNHDTCSANEPFQNPAHSQALEGHSRVMGYKTHNISSSRFHGLPVSATHRRASSSTRSIVSVA